MSTSPGGSSVPVVTTSKASAGPYSLGASPAQCFAELGLHLPPALNLRKGQNGKHRSGLSASRGLNEDNMTGQGLHRTYYWALCMETATALRERDLRTPSQGPFLVVSLPDGCTHCTQLLCRCVWSWRTNKGTLKQRWERQEITNDKETQNQNLS